VFLCAIATIGYFLSDLLTSGILNAVLRAIFLFEAVFFFSFTCILVWKWVNRVYK
jgi:hypothetical protein